jgi:transcriptional regulator with XRE-family HTH domain
VRKIREARGVSQERLALDAGLDRSYVGGIERGERNPSLTNVFRIADALGVLTSAIHAEAERQL